MTNPLLCDAMGWELKRLSPHLSNPEFWILPNGNKEYHYFDHAKDPFKYLVPWLNEQGLTVNVACSTFGMVYVQLIRFGKVTNRAEDEEVGQAIVLAAVEYVGRIHSA